MINDRLSSALLSVLLACSATVTAGAGHSHSSSSHSHGSSHSGSHSSHCHTRPSHRSVPAGHHFFGFFGHRNRTTNSNAVPSGATAECADGTFSFSPNRQEACLDRGGVKRWLR